MKKLAALAVAIMVGGCVPPVMVENLSAGQHRMRADFDFFSPVGGAADTLNRRALAVCGGSYSVAKQEVEGTGTTGTLVWDVRCRG